MLTDSKDKCIVDRQPSALRLREIQIMSKRVGGGMAHEKLIGRVHPAMGNGQDESERMGIIADGMHEAALAGVHFERALGGVAREESFDREAFRLATGDPFRLC